MSIAPRPIDDTSTSLWRYREWVEPELPVLSLAFVLMSFSTLGALALPWVGRDVLDSVSRTGDVGELDRKMVVLLVLWVGAAIASYLELVVVSYAGLRVVNRVRKAVFSRLLRLPAAFFDHARTGDLITRFSTDVDLIQETLTGDVIRLAGNACKVGGGLILLFLLDWRLTSAFGFIVVLLPITYRFLWPRLRSFTRRSLDAFSGVLGTFGETITHIRVVKTFARETHEEKRIGNRLDEVFQLAAQSSRFEALILTTMSASFTTVLLCVLWYGGRNVLSGEISLGTVLAYLMTVSILAAPLVSLAGLYTRLARARAATDRIFEILDVPPEPADPPNASVLKVTAGEIVFDHVHFGYEASTPVLKDFMLTMPAGKTTALVGASGSGKTTAAMLLYRLYEPWSGELRVDGTPLSSTTRESLRTSIAWVPQEAHLFDGSIRENIRYGRLEATDAEIEDAARQAHVHEFAQGLPLGLETIVGERGVRLSGGQRQRIAIARAIVKNARILVLDEATSALDPHSESLVREALAHLMRGRTTLVIAHRLATIRDAEQIVVLAHGRVLATGRHEELMRESAYYARLYDLARQQDQGPTPSHDAMTQQQA